MRVNLTSQPWAFQVLSLSIRVTEATFVKGPRANQLCQPGVLYLMWPVLVVSFMLLQKTGTRVRSSLRAKRVSPALVMRGGKIDNDQERLEKQNSVKSFHIKESRKSSQFAS